MMAQFQTDTQSLSGIVGLCFQGGAFGLLCYIIIWMYPKARKDEADERDRHVQDFKVRDQSERTEREQRDARFEKIIEQIHQKFDSRNDKIVSAIEQQTKDFEACARETAASTTAAISGACKHAVTLQNLPRRDGPQT